MTAPPDALPAAPIVVPELQRQKPHRSIPSLDGLRAVAVCSVILSHFNGFSDLPKTGLRHHLMTLLGLGGLGVTTFFVISGFLITTLLLQEKERDGKVDLKRFYFRRTLRICPPFYVYLAVATVVAAAVHRPLAGRLLLAAGAYAMDYVPTIRVIRMPSFWLVGHSWSLAVEEQFYLFWPLLVLVATHRRALQWCVGIAATVPLLRLATLELLPIYRPGNQWFGIFHGCVDMLVYGALLALLLRQERFAQRIGKLFHPALLGAAAVFLPLSAVIASHTPAWFDALVVVSLTGMAITLLLAWVVLKPGTLVGRFLNLAPVRHLGLISYSLYLWQQMFVGPQWVPSRPVNLLVIVAVAELSFWLVERPSLRLRAWLERRWFPARRAAVQQAAR